jgi:predicted nucleic acid-binding protein
VADVPQTVHDCPDHEDNLILDLAAEVGALLIVSSDTDLLSIKVAVARDTNHRADRVRRKKWTQCAGTHADDADKP